jgi:hypothetical protein
MIRCAQTGKSGSGTMSPEAISASEGAMRAMPSPETVQSSEMVMSVFTALVRSSAPSRATANAAADGSDGGSAMPRNGTATRNIGRARSSVGALRAATARTYQRLYRSSGRANS